MRKRINNEHNVIYWENFETFIAKHRQTHNAKCNTTTSIEEPDICEYDNFKIKTL